jgi:hypothetical protein
MPDEWSEIKERPSATRPLARAETERASLQTLTGQGGASFNRSNDVERSDSLIEFHLDGNYQLRITAATRKP